MIDWSQGYRLWQQGGTKAVDARITELEAEVERLREERDALTRCIKHMVGEGTDVESLIRTHVRALRREAASGEQA